MKPKKPAIEKDKSVLVEASFDPRSLKRVQTDSVS